MKTVLVIDATGRGHALCDLFVRTDPHVKVFYGPGCPLVVHPRIKDMPAISLTDPATALHFLTEHPVDLVFVANIDALCKGYVDCLRLAGHRVIGPTQAAAELETSKLRGKEFCKRHGIPTAAWAAFASAEAAHAHINAHGAPCVVKADGLTPDGDGSVVCENREQAHQAIDTWAHALGRQFRVVIEQYLEGDEISIFALLDGKSHLTFPTAKDYKRTHEGARGKNCDGMGSISPHPRADAQLAADIEATILQPLVRGLRKEQIDFSGFIYVGAMLTAQGIRVIEINARFGDSEAEVVLPGVGTSFSHLCEAVINQTLSGMQLDTDGLSRCTVALTQGATQPGQPGGALGWPFGEVPTGQVIHGIEACGATAQIFFANVALNAAGIPITAGGRVLHVVGRGQSVDEARQHSYATSKNIHFCGVRYRTDIGQQGA